MQYFNGVGRRHSFELGFIFSLRENDLLILFDILMAKMSPFLYPKF